MLVSCWTMYGIAAVIIFLRGIAKLRINLRLGWDDFLIILALVFDILPLWLD